MKTHILQGQIVSWCRDTRKESWRSREDFVITRHSDGSRVLRAFCQLYENDIVRDVLTAVDEEMRPKDATIGVFAQGVRQGSAWYTFTDEMIHCESDTKEGRISQAEPWRGATRGLGTHALTSDAWLLARLEMSELAGRQTLEQFPIPSIHHLGATGPGLEFVSADVDYLGTEEVTVMAGAFSCHHFQFVATSNDHPTYDVWLSADDDFLFVKGFVGGDWNVNFELRCLNDLERPDS